MRNTERRKDYKYSGVLAEICAAFIDEKRAVGYIYNSEAKKLSEFSRFTLAYDIPMNTLTEEVVKAWIAKKPTDSYKNRAAKYSLVKQLGEYMSRLGYSAYITGFDDIGKCKKTFTPYIFTHTEISKFFTAADSLEYKAKSIAPRRHLIMPVLFRMLYCCGLRVSEACELHGDEVDLENGVLIVRKSKFSKTRYVPMSKELTIVCVKYNETRLVGKGDDDWFFIAPDGGRYDNRTIYGTFRELLLKSGISHGGKGKGPRVHDFRHTFAVHCLQRWVERGANPTTVLPRLTAYLGHCSFSSTEEYLRMTAEIFPQISEIMQKQFGYIIPIGKDVAE